MSGVSVIVPVYNREKYLEACLRSILTQECDFPVEIIVADDGSTDRSLEIARSFGSPVVVLEKPAECRTQGCGATRNRGIVASRHPLIAFLDSDDLYLPGHLQRLYDVLAEDPDLHAAVDRIYVMENDRIEGKWPTRYPDKHEVALRSVFLSSYISCDVIMLRRSLFDKIGGLFDESQFLSEDTDLFLRILEKYRIRIVDGDGAVAREHDGRSIRDVRKVVASSGLTTRTALKRYPYPADWIRKRNAVGQYRLARACLSERKYVRALIHAVRVLCLDPLRVLKAVVRRKID